MKKQTPKGPVTATTRPDAKVVYPGAKDPKIKAFVRGFYAKHGNTMSKLAYE